MLHIKGFSDKPCFMTGATKDVVDVKLKDGSFAGSVSWDELLKILRRKNGTPERRTSGETAAGK